MAVTFCGAPSPTFHYGALNSIRLYNFCPCTEVAYKEIGNYERAIELHQRALDIAIDLEDKTLQAQALNNLGVTFRTQGDYPQAINAYEQSLILAEETGDVERQINALGNLGYAHLNSGNYQQAVSYYEQAITLSQEIGSWHEFTLGLFLMRSYVRLGYSYSHQGNYRQSIDLFQKSLDLASNWGVHENTEANFYTWEALNGLGQSYRNLGDYQRALAFFKQCLQFARQTEDLNWESIASGNLGNVYSNLGNPQKGIEYHEQALLIYQALQDRSGEGATLRNLGGAHAALGNYQQATRFYEEGLEIARELEDQQGIFSALIGLSEIDRVFRGSYTLGRNEEALEVARAIGNPIAIGDALSILGTSSYLVSPDGNSLTYNASGPVSAANFQYLEEALELYRSAAVRPREASVLVDLARAYLIKELPDVAEGYLIDATQIFDDLRDNVSEDIDRISLFQAQVTAFSLLQEALAEQGKFETALEAAEQGRGRALVTLLSQQTENELKNLTPDITPDIDAIKQTAQQTASTLVAYSIVRDTDRNYETNRLFSGYDIGDEFNWSLYIWVVSPKGTATFRRVLLNGLDLSNFVSDSRQAIGVRGTRTGAAPQLRPEELARRQAEQDKKLSQLHDILIEPIADLLPTDPRQPVVFIPQGELFLVPFPALKDDNGDYLIENHTILTAPSIQVLQLTHEIAAQSPSPAGRGARGEGNSLVVGNPTMPTVTFFTDEGEFVDTQLSPLSGALKEANEVSEFLGAPALTGDQATEATVKQQLARADLIHLATHGLLEYGDPRETGTRDVPGAIALAPGSGEDGLLTSAEILQMDLQANLVVLSACDTGRGRITGDGVIGLSRSFIAAGVPSVIVSLWSVPDAPTAELMTEFYRQLDQGQSKAQALRQAMLITMQTHPDPKDWAAFTLIGESE